MHFWDFNCPYPSIQLALIASIARSSRRDHTVVYWHHHFTSQLVPRALQGRVNRVSMTIAYLEHSLAHTLPQGGEAFGCGPLIAMAARPRLCRNSLRMVSEGSGEDGVLTIQFLLRLADVAITRWPMLACVLQWMIKSSTADSAAATIRRPRQSSLPSN